MKKFFVVMVVLQCLSCASAPTPPPEEPAEVSAPVSVSEPAAPVTPDVPAVVEVKVNQALIDELNAARAREEAARARAGYFEGAIYFPSDWESAESRYAEAGQMSQDTDDEVKKAVAAYNAVVDAYDYLFELTIPLYAQAREDEIMTARSRLIASGLRDSFPDYFPPADKTALEALSQYEAKDYYTAKDTAASALLMYQTMLNGWNAWLVRREINEREFAGYDPENYESAEKMLDDALAAYDGAANDEAYKNAGEALTRYKLVLSNGWAAYAQERASLASLQRQAALDAKANIATRELFAEADTSYKAATDAFTSQKHEDAAKNFINAEALFVIAADSAAEKRRRAEELIKQANEKIVESDETAAQAEIAIEGGAE